MLIDILMVNISGTVKPMYVLQNMVNISLNYIALI